MYFYMTVLLLGLNSYDMFTFYVPVSRPVPLSSVVNRVQRSQVISQAMLIKSVMNKVQEVSSLEVQQQPAAGYDRINR